jgi:hypothetical protein
MVSFRVGRGHCRSRRRTPTTKRLRALARAKRLLVQRHTRSTGHFNSHKVRSPRVRSKNTTITCWYQKIAPCSLGADPSLTGANSQINTGLKFSWRSKLFCGLEKPIFEVGPQ